MIEIRKINKSFHENHILKDVTFTFEKSKTNLIIGESGSGKTTLLKILIGLYKHDSGSVLFNQQKDRAAQFGIACLFLKSHAGIVCLRDFYILVLAEFCDNKPNY